MFNGSQFNSARFNAGVAGITLPLLPAHNFHDALANWLYPNMLERERLTLFGIESQAELISVTPLGETVIYTLTDGPWSARRIPTIENEAPEQWRLEIWGEHLDIDWNQLKYVTKVRMRGAIDEEQVYEVLDRYNAMKPGRVYHIRMQAKANIDPS